MKFPLIACLGLIAAAIANPVAANPFERGMGFRLLVQDQRPQPAPQREADRSAPSREADRFAPARDVRAPGDADRGRMNPDDRRQLRRDIQDAGKDIYPRDRHPPGRQQRK
jgi:hypothetical protein